MPAPAAAHDAQRHHLLVFDFDHTIVDGNTDTHVVQAAPSGNKLPPELKAEPGRWTEYMQRVLSHLHSAEGVRVQDMRAVLSQMQYTPGMQHLLEALRGGTLGGPGGPPCSAIIVSDSNTAFIDWVLQHRGHAELFSHVYSNPATVCQQQQQPEGGVLTVAPHHAHDCPACPVNMCKRAVVQQHLAAAHSAPGPPPRVCYVGDGGNDLCAAQALAPDDVVFVRAGFRLDDSLRSDAAGSVRAHVVRWTSGEEILDWLLASAAGGGGSAAAAPAAASPPPRG